MFKKNLKFIILFVLVISLLLCFSSCTSQKSDLNSDYVIAKSVCTFSKLNNIICWTTGDDLFLENESEIKSSIDFNLDKDPYYNKPLLIDNYLYYIGGVYNYDKHEVYIARIDYTINKPEIEILTKTYNDIQAYTVHDSYLYYTAYDSKTVLYRMNLITKSDNIVTDNSIGDVFCTNGDNIIMGNLIFDIKNQKKQTISYDKELFALGVFNNNYYCYYDNNNNHYKVLQVNLNDNSIVELCEIPYGMDIPQMYDDKILFTDLSDNCINVGYYYYDIPTDTIVTVINSDNSTLRYNESSYEPIHYDYIIHNNMYYFHYSDTITRMNINTKKEELFQLILKPTDNGWYTNRYEWVSYSDYYESR